jgi:hypothetical protein
MKELPGWITKPKRATSKWAEAVKNFELRKLELQREKNDNFKKQEKETEEILKRESKARMDEMLKKIRIEKLVADSYHFSRKKVLEELKELNDMGFSDKVICQILEFNPAVLQSFKEGHKPNTNNFIKLKEGLVEIKKQHKDKGDE